MSKKILLRKTYSVYANDMHLVTMIFPFIKNEVENGAIIKPILEKDVSKNMKKVIKNVGLSLELKEKIGRINWKQTNIEKIRKDLNEIENLLESNGKVNVIVLGSNEFIEKINELFDIWFKINLKNIEEKNILINIINCYDFEKNENIEELKRKHNYLLNTLGIEEIYNDMDLKKAN